MSSYCDRRENLAKKYTQRGKRSMNKSLRASLHRRSDAELKRLWDKAGRLYPGLHPDDYASPDGGWPSHLRALAAEVFHRHALGRVTDDELYWAAALEEFIGFVTGEKKDAS